MDKGRVARFHLIALDTNTEPMNIHRHIVAVWCRCDPDVIRQEDAAVAAYLCKWPGKCCGRGHNGHSSTSNTFVKNTDEVMRAGRLVSLKLLKLTFSVSCGSA